MQLCLLPQLVPRIHKQLQLHQDILPGRSAEQKADFVPLHVPLALVLSHPCIVSRQRCTRLSAGSRNPTSACASRACALKSPQLAESAVLLVAAADAMHAQARPQRGF
jgi:hypothetical protein